MDSKKDELIKILDTSSDKNHNISIFFLLFLAYVIVTVVSITDVQLLVSTMGVNLPLLNIIVPFNWFFIVAPIIVVCFYANIIANFVEHVKKLEKMEPNNQISTSRWPFFLDFAFTKDSGILFHIFHFLITFFLPLATLTAIFIKYGRSQNFSMNKFHIAIFLIGVLLFIYYRFKISVIFKISIFKTFLYVISLSLMILFVVGYYYLLHGIETSKYPNSIKGLPLSIINWLATKQSYSDSSKINKPTGTKWLSSRSFFPSLKIDRNEFISLPSIEQWLAYNSIMGKKSIDKADIYTLNDSNFPRLDLSDKSMYNISLIGAFLPNADFTNANLQGANFTDANLQGANFTGANLQGVDFRDANIRGANFTGALNLQYANFHYANLQGNYFEGANFEGANFTGANLQGVHFYVSFFDGASFSNANLQGAQLYMSSFIGTDFTDANLQGAVFCPPKDVLITSPEGRELYLYGANIMGANFTGAKLQGAELYNTNGFQGAFFSESNLFGASIKVDEAFVAPSLRWEPAKWDDILNMSDEQSYKDAIQRAIEREKLIGDSSRSAFEKIDMDVMMERWKESVKKIACNNHSIASNIFNFMPSKYSSHKFSSKEFSTKFCEALLDVYDYCSQTMPSITSDLEKERINRTNATTPAQTLRNEILNCSDADLLK